MPLGLRLALHPRLVKHRPIVMISHIIASDYVLLHFRDALSHFSALCRCAIQLES